MCRDLKVRNTSNLGKSSMAWTCHVDLPLPPGVFVAPAILGGWDSTEKQKCLSQKCNGHTRKNPFFAVIEMPVSFHPDWFKKGFPMISHYIGV